MKCITIYIRILIDIYYILRETKLFFRIDIKLFLATISDKSNLKYSILVSSKYLDYKTETLINISLDFLYILDFYSSLIILNTT